ncbi:MAG TPA: rhomboid family intramembrane serine protease [Chitinophagaceae bacterium]|nr:rhomboid family intramembrane serine protease [Chitinophagaceae bacterium]
MSRSQVHLPAGSSTAEEALALSLAACRSLNWLTGYATAERLVAFTKNEQSGERVVIEWDGDGLLVDSQYIEDRLIDLARKNRKHTAAFTEAFELVQATAEKSSITEWTAALRELQEQTGRQLSEQAVLQEEVEKVMRISSGSRWITYGLIAANLLIFIFMVVGGASLLDPSSEDIIRWGGNYKPMTEGGEWWRLFTAMFLHIGVVHLLLNMYGLFMIGNYLEPMLGKVLYAVAYLVTGLLASLTSLWWHDANSVSAGASGAIFGIEGVFLALLTTSLIPKAVRGPLLKGMAVFIVYNLVYGLKGEVDNAAHIGGLLSGLVLGYLYYFFRKDGVQKVAVPALAALLLTAGGIAYYLSAHQDNTGEYLQSLQEFSRLEKEALAPLGRLELNTKTETIQDLESVTMAAWKDCDALLKKIDDLNLNRQQRRQHGLLTEYVDLRMQETDLYIQLVGEDSTAARKLVPVQEKINEKLEALTATVD